MKTPPFSHQVLAGDIAADGRRYRLEADAEERRLLAEALRIPEVVSLAAEVEVRPVRGRAFRVRGSLTAAVVQTDVVTLEPLAQDVAEEIDVTLIPAEGVGRSHRKEILVDAVEADAPDVYRNGRIDLGVIVTEHLALGLDPYPRAPGVDFPGHIEDEPAKDPSPFAMLAKLRSPEE